jgi:hypothetical protein
MAWNKTVGNDGDIFFYLDEHEKRESPDAVSDKSFQFLLNAFALNGLSYRLVIRSFKDAN